MKKFLGLAFIFSFIVYLLTSAGRTPYDYFTRLSDSFLQGKLYLTQNPPWLNELIPAGPNKFYVVYPPMPAILAMPFRLIFGQLFEQQYLAQLLGAGIVILTMCISFSIKKDKKLAIWAGFLAGFGTIIWFLAATGSAWYLSQVSAAFFMSAAILESLNKKRPILIGVLLGAAYLSRIEIILSLPFFLYILWDKNWLKNYLKMAMGLAPFIFTDFLYNFLRFGVVWDKSYILIPGVLNESWYQNGLFSPLNIPNHLKIIFLALPKFIPQFPYIEPSWAGLAIWITTPAFIYALIANIKEKIIRFSWLSILLISLLIFSHGTTGFSQFGYRFAVDFYPILIFLTIKGAAKTGLKWHHYLLLTLSILVNLWGVTWINKFGWVSF
ncbi:MAG: hypothetical protein ABSE04_01245 [Candidatus Microgenomates bacterium]|jgi:hypothetical protein